MKIFQTYAQAPMLALLLLGFAACKKVKSDFDYDNRLVIENRKKSNVRIINLGGYNQVIANGDSLSNFYIVNPNDPASLKPPGTSYFPKDGKLGKIWEMPMDIFDKDEKANLDILTRNYFANNNQDLNLTAENSYSNPYDYYLLQRVHVKDLQPMIRVERGVHAPSKPDHFKIRILNFTGQSTNNGNGVRGMQEELRGALTLAFADGTPVNEKTSTVAINTSSEYVELPYGTYQFKVLTADGRQIAAVSSSDQLYDYTVMEPATSTIAIGYAKSSELTHAPIATYQPGGIYTVVVSPQQYNYYINDIGESSSATQNMFQVITDNGGAANLTYCRLQAANALGDQLVSIRVNGKQLGDIGFGTATDYSGFVTGTYTIEALDAAGKVLARTEQLLRASQNYTAWLYPAADGTAKLLIVSNDLSGTSYPGGSDDGTFNRLKFDYFFNKRFLNLSPDNAYISFTKANGQPFSPISVNLQPGTPFTVQPYAAGGFSEPEYPLMAYRSAPNVVPGVWADDIPLLSSRNFIARRELYTNAGRVLPAQEPGVYTVALIGRSTGGSAKAKMMIIKHNK